MRKDMLLVLGHGLGLGPAPEGQEKHLPSCPPSPGLREAGLPKQFRDQVGTRSGLGKHELRSWNSGISWQQYPPILRCPVSSFLVTSLGH